MGAPRFVMDDFWPSDLFLGGIPGAWYDPTDLSTMFQDNTGLTPVTAVEQPVGLIFDKSQGTPAARYNLLTYSEDYANAAWTKTNVTLTSGQLAPDGTNTAFVLTGTAAYARIESTAVSYAAATYTLSVYVKKASGTMAIAFSNAGSPDEVAFDIGTGTVGTKGANVSSASVQDAGAWWRLVAVSTRTAASQPIRIFAGYPTNISPIVWGAQLQTGSTATTYQKITTGIGGEWTPGNHARQSTAASRPTYRARYNALTQSEDFSQAVWTKVNANVSANSVTAPDGTTTADTLTPTAVLGYHLIIQAVAVTNGAAYTFSYYVRPNGYTKIALVEYQTTGNFVTFDLTGAGSVITASGAVGTIASVGGGWYRVTHTSNAGSGTFRPDLWVLPNSYVSGSYLFTWTPDGTSGVYVWGAQLLTAADVTATGNAYQRIAAATVYDTAPIFRPYLAFDGVDDSLSTAAINFTSTDKMTVFVGASKLSDVAAAILTELSATTASNAGSFYIAAPEATGASGNFTYKSRGSLDITPTSPGVYLAPTTRVLSGIGDIAGDTAILRINGAQAVNSTGDQGTGNYGNYPLFIGRRGGTTLPFNGRLFSLIVRGAASSTTEIIDTETWVNARTGAY